MYSILLFFLLNKTDMDRVAVYLKKQLNTYALLIGLECQRKKRDSKKNPTFPFSCSFILLEKKLIELSFSLFFFVVRFPAVLHGFLMFLWRLFVFFFDY